MTEETSILGVDFSGAAPDNNTRVAGGAPADGGGPARLLPALLHACCTPVARLLY